MIKTKVRSLLKAIPVLQELSQKSLPIKTSYGIAKLIVKVNAELEIFDKSRIDLCEKYGKLDEETRKYNITDDAFYAEYDKLLDIDVDVEANPVVLYGDASFTAQQLIAIEDFIVIEGEDK